MHTDTRSSLQTNPRPTSPHKRAQIPLGVAVGLYSALVRCSFPLLQADVITCAASHRTRESVSGIDGDCLMWRRAPGRAHRTAARVTAGRTKPACLAPGRACIWVLFFLQEPAFPLLCSAPVCTRSTLLRNRVLREGRSPFWTAPKPSRALVSSF